MRTSCRGCSSASPSPFGEPIWKLPAGIRTNLIPILLVMFLAGSIERDCESRRAAVESVPLVGAGGDGAGGGGGLSVVEVADGGWTLPARFSCPAKGGKDRPGAETCPSGAFFSFLSSPRPTARWAGAAASVTVTGEFDPLCTVIDWLQG